VNTIVVLMGLLLLSYVGSFFTSGREGRGAGLPSSSEFLVLGVLAGPLVFNALQRSSLETFDPIAYVAIGWLALSCGLEYGHVGAQRVGLLRLLLGILTAVACFGAIACVTWFAIPFVVELSKADRLLLSGGMGCVGAETTRHAIDWAVQRRSAKGPLTDLLSDFAHSDEVVPIAAVAFLFALRAPQHATVHLPPIGWAGATIGVGVVLGVLTTLLLARDLRVAESWGTLLGTSLMTIGLAARLDLAAVTALFALGASIGWFSRHRTEVRAMINSTERAVTLPALVLAGARIEPASIGRLVLLVPLVVIVRLAMKAVTAELMRTRGAARGSSRLLGLGLSSSGGMSVLIGLAIALRFPGRIGDTILACAVATSVAGELAGPIALQRVLLRAGEIVEPEPVPQEGAAEESEQAAEPSEVPANIPPPPEPETAS